MSLSSSLRQDSEARSTVSEQQEERLDVRLCRLAPQPVAHELVKRFGRIVDILEAKRAIQEAICAAQEKERRIDADLRTELRAVEVPLKEAGNWYITHEEIGKELGRCRRSVTRLLDSPAPFPSASSEWGDVSIDLAKRKVSSVSGESELSPLAKEAISVAEKRLGRKVKF